MGEFETVMQTPGEAVAFQFLYFSVEIDFIYEIVLAWLCHMFWCRIAHLWINQSFDRKWPEVNNQIFIYKLFWGICINNAYVVKWIKELAASSGKNTES